MICEYCQMYTGDGGSHATIQDCLDALVRATERLKTEFAARETSMARLAEVPRHESQFQERLLPDPE